ncbi:MAG: tRNA glutamyl-Q(34) synthetase GluQRS [Gammaproteobacteria bacterium]|nr:tRNA glutamyl-Q(34) synthetase GluQRS [Gammaproteobacteria bacterium]
MAPNDPTAYTGRFAPSPTGPLHFGSLIAALGSFLQARSQGGNWLVRIEDIDAPREVAGSADLILRTLDAFGLHWDHAVLYQSSRLDAYRAAVDQLLQARQAYRCVCTRKIVQQLPGGVYPGLCREAAVAVDVPHSIRVRTDDQPVTFADAIQGPYEQRLHSEVGDFVIKRRDGLYAYQLAVAVDDAWQGVTDVVRGCDLLASTPRQIHLLSLLGLSRPGYAHLPVALDSQGMKLSKSAGSMALDLDDRRQTLHQALTVLGQKPPPQGRHAPLEDQLGWAIKNWDISHLENISAVELDDKRQVLQTLSRLQTRFSDPLE